MNDLTDTTIIIIAIVAFLAGSIVMYIVLISRINRLDEDPPTRSADEWWRDAERIKAAVKAANEQGIERAVLPKQLED